MELTRRESFVLVGCMAIIGMILYYLYFYQPIKRENDLLVDQLSQLEEGVLEMQGMAGEVSQIKIRSNHLIENDNDIIKGFNQAQFVVYIEKIIQPLGQEKIIRFEGSTEYDIYSVEKILISLETSYSNIYTLLKEIEESPWKSRVERLTIIQRKNPIQPSLYDIDVEILLGVYCL